MADKKAAVNPWANLNYTPTAGSNQVSASTNPDKIKPTAEQNKGKLFFPKYPGSQV